MNERPEAERAFLLKQAIKEAITEWLNEKFAQFGRWSLLGICATALAVLAWFVLIKSGWTPPR